MGREMATLKAPGEEVVMIRAALFLIISVLLLANQAQAAQSACRVADPTGTALNVRTTPNGKIVSTLNNGTSVSLLDRTSDHNGRSWGYVGSYPSLKPIGWVYSDFLDCAALGSHPATGKTPIGWMKTPDIGCNEVDGKEYCTPLDHYTDAYQQGDDCATYGTPFYDRPNGKPIGLLFGEEEVLLGEKSKDRKWTRVWSPKTDRKDIAIMPYSIKSLRGCG